jgi:hypothetical protein
MPGRVADDHHEPHPEVTQPGHWRTGTTQGSKPRPQIIQLFIITLVFAVIYSICGIIYLLLLGWNILVNFETF